MIVILSRSEVRRMVVVMVMVIVMGIMMGRGGNDCGIVPLRLILNTLSRSRGLGRYVHIYSNINCNVVLTSKEAGY